MVVFNGATTFGITTLNLMAFVILTLSITAGKLVTLGSMTLCLKTLSILHDMPYNKQHNNAQHKDIQKSNTLNTLIVEAK
jgi:hypothetical protein